MAQQSVLVIDDSADIHALVAARLKPEGLILHHAERPDEGIRMARDLRPDLILLDVDMPEASGFEVCRRLKADPRTSMLPVIFLTGVSQVYSKVEGFELGAVDYVTKPFEPAELRARVRAALRTKRYQDLLGARAEIDALTGLFNRAHFDRRLAEGIAEHETNSVHVALVLLDLDHFKNLNDTYGHPFGDRVLQTIGEALASTARDGDAACRYGGEEFGIILQSATFEGARSAAERFQTRLARVVLEHGGKAVVVTASIGVASSELFPMPGSLTGAKLIAAADAALYEAKHTGRNRICFAAARPLLHVEQNRAVS
jgi:two-component system, cell cycle response regulator